MPVTNEALYNAIDAMRKELKGDILRTEIKVDNVVSGPMAAAQKDITDLKVKDATLSTKIYMLVFIVSTVTSTLITATLTAVIFKVLGVQVH